MWTPNITTPVVKMLCHRGALKAAAVDVSGRYLVTSGEIMQQEATSILLNTTFPCGHAVKSMNGTCPAVEQHDEHVVAESQHMKIIALADPAGDGVVRMTLQQELHQSLIAACCHACQHGVTICYGPTCDC